MHYKTHISLIREYILLLNSDMCQGGKPDTGKFQSSYIDMRMGAWSMARVLQQRFEYSYTVLGLYNSHFNNHFSQTHTYTMSNNEYFDSYYIINWTLFLVHNTCKLIVCV